MDADGLVHVPRVVPGIGVAVDMECIDSLTVRRKVLRPPARAAAA